MTRTRSRRVTAGALGVVMAIGAVAGVQAAASAATSSTYVTGAGRATVGGDNVRLAVGVFDSSRLTGAVSYFDGDHWLTSTYPVALKVVGRVARIKGEGRWKGHVVAYYLQLKDRSPKRPDAFSIRVKSGKTVVLKQSGVLTAGDLIVGQH